MSNTNRIDIRTAGVGTIATGAYRSINVSGSATLTGDVDCIDLKVSGGATGGGTLRSENITVLGLLDYRGDVDVDEMRVSGTASTRGLRARELNTTGTLNASSLTATTVNVLGHLRIDGDCEAERFTAQGLFTVVGLLNAGVVDVTLGGKCVASEIGGEAVTVHMGVGPIKKFVSSYIPGMEMRLTAQSIEGDHIHLESTTARVVRGNSVVIGPDCKIDLVEYAGEYTVSPESFVGEARKLSADEPPVPPAASPESDTAEGTVTPEAGEE